MRQHAVQVSHLGPVFPVPRHRFSQAGDPKQNGEKVRCSFQSSQSSVGFVQKFSKRPKCSGLSSINMLPITLYIPFPNRARSFATRDGKTSRSKTFRDLLIHLHHAHHHPQAAGRSGLGFHLLLGVFEGGGHFGRVPIQVAHRSGIQQGAGLSCKQGTWGLSSQEDR